MQNYINLILDKLPGETPKDKFENLVTSQLKLLNRDEAIKIWEEADRNNPEMGTSILTYHQRKRVEELKK